MFVFQDSNLVKDRMGPTHGHVWTLSLPWTAILPAILPANIGADESGTPGPSGTTRSSGTTGPSENRISTLHKRMSAEFGIVMKW